MNSAEVNRWCKYAMELTNAKTHRKTGKSPCHQFPVGGLRISIKPRYVADNKVSVSLPYDTEET